MSEEVKKKRGRPARKAYNRTNNKQEDNDLQDEVLNETLDGIPEMDMFYAGKELDIGYKKLRNDAQVPTKATYGSACFDLYAAETKRIEPNQTVVIGTGLAFEIPSDHVMLIFPRSGISVKSYLRQPNSVGVIDSDYRGEVKLIFENTAFYDNRKPQWDREGICYTPNGERSPDCIEGQVVPVNTYIVSKGQKIAQAMVIPYNQVVFTERELSETERGQGGLGSTGV